MNLEKVALDYLAANETSLVEIASAIWERPELGLQETYAAGLIAGRLGQEGFSIEIGAGEMETAFVASWGQGQPIIGILGEYDALPGLSQRVSNTKDPIVEGGPGQGCGHNLLGTGALGAALAAKAALERSGVEGTIRFYGCPAEETLTGKVFMAREGVFDDLDAALTWHPSFVNSVWASICTAVNSFKVNFYGIASHAAAAPEAGRSALDGVQLMDVGVNYMREHMPPQAKVHCVITEGGEAPNVVPPYAQVWYYVRAPNREQVDHVYAWMCDIAQGAALMTGTTHDIEFLSGCYNTLPNDLIGDLLLQKMRLVGTPEYTEKELELADQLQDSFPPGSIEKGRERHKLAPDETREPLLDAIFEPRDKGEVVGGSTDVGDVSYIVPTAQITTVCHAFGTPGHSWQAVVTSGSSIGHKGMMLAARTLALATLDLVTTPEHLQAAWREFEKRKGGQEYRSPLPEGAVLPATG
ncbi:MAG: amidohydrolase [Anaerolineae bacterium]|jgi:aminobenzoyl-glutamate utilization protein B